MVNCTVERICGLFMGRGKCSSLWCIAPVRKSVSECRDHKIKHVYSVQYYINIQLDHGISQTGFYHL